ncbi:SDR family oxidoreductase [Cellulophaga sp. E16_2]|uniref:Short-chain dehydrogenase/reductase SDR n=1 Tax=Cellulophaga algicola (strain DSM 14237 / IC166 / ACAM 630) TaxID=688270 RepID=E6X9Y0_CELAD|nr:MULTISPECIES: SDR family oxidoreductase [Cellulophaga]ADV50941.1 short-chain dehydrogenase/reductase SDR [Cellulophaga algicola DSM 14237]MBO0593320.1 SDR family oxidoreductase [Cellulophaga sp. E16_2]
MEQKVVLITGGSSGIGKSIGIFLKSKGFKVYGTTRSKIKYPDFDAFDLLELDVKKEETITAAILELIKREGRIDVLVNNAGIGITGPIEETPNAEIVKAFDTNFHGPIRMIKAVLPQMRIQKSGLVINITSIAGFMGLPYRGIYSATKGALELVTEAMRMEIKDFGVQMTNLAPGDFATNIASGRYHAPVIKDSPYEKPYRTTLDAINNDVDSGGNPMQVAHKVFAIINKANPKVHYKVGDFMQKFSLLLKNILPDKVYEKLLINHYKL